MAKTSPPGQLCAFQAVIAAGSAHPPFISQPRGGPAMLLLSIELTQLPALEKAWPQLKDQVLYCVLSTKPVEKGTK